MKNIELKLTPKQIKLYTNLAIFVIITSAIVYVSMFLYKNFIHGSLSFSNISYNHAL